ncbi:cytochrome b5 reductase 4-like isoform X1 [Montipora capricornis]|uniref:cytochrome b5 reductase 4-like isoform X1 n=1 Tax=Montipora capricornis TaxID=246305 RepID=UPI0035F1BBD0
MTAPKISFPAENSPQRANSSGSLNIRAKVVPLKPGRSLMDWIRLGKSTKDLAGTGGIVRPVTEEELGKHNSENDAWICIRGRVYNITPYLEYHPGGIPEIMRGVGRDGTDLFDETHKWVNAESMLEKCFIGPLKRDIAIKVKPRTGSGRYLNSSSVSLKSHNSLFVPGAQDNGFAVPVAPPSSPDPRYDWYQNDKIVTISVYTKKKDLRLEDIILELKDGKDFNAIFILGIKSFQIHLVLSNVVTCQQVRISGATGKADVLLTKETSGVKWTDLGQGLLGNNSLKLHKDRESRLWDCRVVSVEAVTHNCKLFCCELPDGIVMRVPMGHHIHLHRDVEGMKISRPYTVVLPSLRFSLDEREHDGRRFYLMIKIYPDGTLTPTLSAIDVGDILQISDYSGDFKESRLIEARDIILIAGGTGLTPMIRLIRRAVLENSSTETSVKLLFANNQEKDILWKQQLNEMVETASQRFQVYYTVSQPTPEWDGYEGRVSLEMLLEILPPPPSAGHERGLLICICGPDPFTHHIVSTLKDLSYAENMIHAFLG